MDANVKKYQFKTEEPYGWLSPGLRESLFSTIDRITENNRKKEEAKQRAAEKEAFMGNTKKPNLAQSTVKAVKNLPRNRDEIFENTMANLGVLSPANWIATEASALDAGLGLIPGYQRDYDRIYLPTDKDNPRLHGLTGNPTVDEIAGLAADFTMPGVFEYAMASAPRVARGLNALERGISKIGRRTTKVPSQGFVTTATEAPPHEFVTTAPEALPDFAYSYTGLPEEAAKGHTTFNTSFNKTENTLNKSYSIFNPPLYAKKDINNLWSKLDPNVEHFGLGTKIQSDTFDNFTGRLLPEDMDLISLKRGNYVDDTTLDKLNNLLKKYGAPPINEHSSGFSLRTINGDVYPFITISQSQPYPTLNPNSPITANDIGNIVAHEMAHKLMWFSKRFNQINKWTADETAIYLGIDPQQARQALGNDIYEYLFNNGGHEIRARYSEFKNTAGVKEFTDSNHLRDVVRKEAFFGIDNNKSILLQLFNQSNTWDKLRDFGNVWAPMMTGAVFAEPFLKTNNSKTQNITVQ